MTAAATTLTSEQIDALRTRAHREAGPFVDPTRLRIAYRLTDDSERATA